MPRRRIFRRRRLRSTCPALATDAISKTLSRESSFPAKTRMIQTQSILTGNAPVCVAHVADSPSRVKQWELVEFAARGSLARIYRARPVGTPADRPATYAVKMLRPCWQNDPEAIRLLRREAMVGQSVSHPHLVPVLTASVSEPPRLLVMPWLEGASLQARLGRRPAVRRAQDALDRPANRRGARCPARGGLDARRRDAGQHPRFAQRTRHADRPEFRPTRRRDRLGRRSSDHGHVQLHRARAVHVGPSRRHSQRPLQSGRRAVRDAFGPPAVSGQGLGGVGHPAPAIVAGGVGPAGAACSARSGRDWSNA